LTEIIIKHILPIARLGYPNLFKGNIFWTRRKKMKKETVIVLMVASLIAGIFIGEASFDLFGKKKEVSSRIMGRLDDPIKLYGFRVVGKKMAAKNGKIFYSVDLENILPESRKMTLGNVIASKWMHDRIELDKDYLCLKDLPPTDPNAAKVPAPNVTDPNQKARSESSAPLF